jgi:hypothetical protein
MEAKMSSEQEAPAFQPKRCPFCGGEGLSFGHKENGISTSGTWYPPFFVRCSNEQCRLIGPKKKHPQEAVAAWNRLAYVPEGWRVVPEEPTDKQKSKGGNFGWDAPGKKTARIVYREMIAAAPPLGNETSQPEEDEE